MHRARRAYLDRTKEVRQERQAATIIQQQVRKRNAKTLYSYRKR
jgi:hypothetical protein